MSNYDWRLFVAMVPEGFGDREEKPRNFRFPVKLGKAIEEIARATDQDVTSTLFFLLQWATTEWKAQRELEKKAASKQG